jgi:hypothetical protein
VLVTLVLNNPLASSVVLSVLTLIVALGYFAQRVENREAAHEAESTAPPSQEPDEQKALMQARRATLAQWVKRDQDFWKLVHDSAMESKMRQVQNWIASDPLLSDDLSEILQRNRPRSVRAIVIQSGQVIAFIVTVGATTVSVILAVLAAKR